MEKASADVDKNFKSLGNGIATGLKVGATAAVGMGAAMLALVPATQEYAQNQAQLNAAFEQANMTSKSATDTYRELYKVIGDDDQAVESAANIAMLADSEQQAAQWAELASGVLGTFHDTLQPEAFYEAANETLKLGEATGAFTQMLEQTGVMSVEEFNKKLAECTTEEEKQALMLEVSKKAMGDAGAAYDRATEGLQAYRDQQAQLQGNLAALGTALTPVVTAFMSFANDALAVVIPYIQQFAEEYGPKIQEVLTVMAEKLAETFNWIQQHSTLLAIIGGVIGTIVVAIGLYNAVAAVKAAMDAAQVVTLAGLAAAYIAQAAAMAVAIAPYVLIVAAIAAVIAIIVVCIKHWDDIKAAVKNAIDGIVGFVKDLVKFVTDDFKQMGENMKQKVEDAKKAVTDKFENIKKNISDKVEAAKSTVSTKFDNIKSTIDNKVESAKSSVTNKFESIKSNITEKLNGAKSNVESAFNTIQNKMETSIQGALTTASSKFDTIKSKITNAINGARDAVDSAVAKIKSTMNFSWSLPKLKLPRISVSGKFSINPPSAPKFSISWYKMGGVFDSPHLFGYGNGMLGGLGEDGAEAVVPLEKNTKWLDIIAEKLSSKQGKTPIILQVDGKTFGEIAVGSINELTRQRGNLPLVMI